jgi:hypothetical protein
MHLLGNTVGLWVYGTALERRIGAGAFAWFLLVSWVLNGVFDMAFAIITVSGKHEDCFVEKCLSRCCQPSLSSLRGCGVEASHCNQTHLLDSDRTTAAST